MNCLVVIPLYTLELHQNEWLSIDVAMSEFSRCGYRVCFVMPEGLPSEALASRYSNYDEQRFASHYFKGISGYNALMLSAEFYERFLSYEHMLIYQSDCYIFDASTLSDWFEYDYVGAPWVAKAHHSRLYYRLYHAILRGICRLQGRYSKVSVYGNVGNGGLSLRRTALFYNIAKSERKSIERYLERGAESNIFNEDVFWSFEPSRHGYKMKKPTATKALGFSFDMKPERCYELAGGVLPMGCHGWNKPQQFPFWSKIIKEAL